MKTFFDRRIVQVGAVLAAVFASYGGYRSGETFVNGMNAAVWIGAIVVAFGSLAAFAIGWRRTRERAPQQIPATETA